MASGQFGIPQVAKERMKEGKNERMKEKCFCFSSKLTQKIFLKHVNKQQLENRRTYPSAIYLFTYIG